MIIEKKVWPEFFAKILSGEKKFELRLADFKCAAGDTLVLKEWNPVTGEYTGRELEKSVSYVIKTKDIRFWTQDDIDRYGYQVISFQ